MVTNLRQKIIDVVMHYQSCQASGIKDVDKQMEIFTEDCAFLCFSAAAVVGTTGVVVYDGKEEISKAFEQYNRHIGQPENIEIEYFDLVIDEENLRCNFNMLLHIKTDPNNPVDFFNMLQFHLNKELKIFKAYNWQGDTGALSLRKILGRFL